MRCAPGRSILNCEDDPCRSLTPDRRRQNRKTAYSARSAVPPSISQARARSAAWQGLAGRCSALLLARCFLPEQAKIQNIVRLSLFLLLGAAVWVLWESARDGVCLFLNRLFAASELQQAYLYEKLPVYAPQAEQAGCLQTAAILLGLLLAQLLTLPSRFSRTFVLAALCGVMAYLGVLPERIWLIALAGCLLLTL